MASIDTGSAVLTLALARGASYSEAAVAAGVGERTVVRRMQNPAFRAEVERVRSAMLGIAMGRLTAAVAGAVDTLADLLHPETLSSVRRGAAHSILGHALRLREHLDHEERLAALEARLDSRERSDALAS